MKSSLDKDNDKLQSDRKGSLAFIAEFSRIGSAVNVNACMGEVYVSIDQRVVREVI